MIVVLIYSSATTDSGRLDTSSSGTTAHQISKEFPRFFHQHWRGSAGFPRRCIKQHIWGQRKWQWATDDTNNATVGREKIMNLVV